MLVMLWDVVGCGRGYGGIHPIGHTYLEVLAKPLNYHLREVYPSFLVFSDRCKVHQLKEIKMRFGRMVLVLV